MTPLEKLKDKINKYIRRTGIAPTTFGRGAVNDPNLLKRLKDDRYPTLRNVERIEYFIRTGKTMPESTDE